MKVRRTYTGKRWPCPVAQSVERLGRSDSITDLARILSWVRIHPLAEFCLSFTLSSAGHRAVGSGSVQGKELWAHSWKRAVGSFHGG